MKYLYNGGIVKQCDKKFTTRTGHGYIPVRGRLGFFFVSEKTLTPYVDDAPTTRFSGDVAVMVVILILTIWGLYETIYT